MAEPSTDYNLFNDKELFNIIKEGNYNSQLLENTIQLRLQNQTLEKRTVVAALFLSESKTIHKALVSYLREPEIVEIFKLAHSLLKEVRVEFVDRKNRESKTTQWLCEMKILVRDLEINTVGDATTKKEARSQAAKLCLSKWIDAI